MKKYNYWIEVPGFLFISALFFCIWVEEYRWEFIFSGFLFLLIAIANFISEKKR